MRDHTKLRVWRRAHELSLEVHAITERFSGRRAAGLKAQLETSSSSIPANIAEGRGQDTDKMFARGLNVAVGSSNETANHLQFAKRRGLIEAEKADSLIEETVVVRRMLLALLKRLRTSD